MMRIEHHSDSWLTMMTGPDYRGHSIQQVFIFVLSLENWHWYGHYPRRLIQFVFSPIVLYSSEIRISEQNIFELRCCKLTTYIVCIFYSITYFERKSNLVAFMLLTLLTITCKLYFDLQLYLSFKWTISKE